jgi:hypothetical protein
LHAARRTVRLGFDAAFHNRRGTGLLGLTAHSNLPPLGRTMLIWMGLRCLVRSLS